MKISGEGFSQLKGSEVHEIVPGVGSFLNLYSSKDDVRYQLWIYLSEWAFTKGGLEVVSSDQSSPIKDFDFSEITRAALTYNDVVILDDEELKIIFSNGINLEIWANSEVYGRNSTMAYLYRNGKLISEIVFDG